jgi:hypothetical protein
MIMIAVAGLTQLGVNDINFKLFLRLSDKLRDEKPLLLCSWMKQWRGMISDKLFMAATFIDYHTVAC